MYIIPQPNNFNLQIIKKKKKKSCNEHNFSAQWNKFWFTNMHLINANKKIK